MMLLSACLSKNFLYFLAFGGTAALVNLGCGYALYRAELLPYFLSVFIGAASGLLVNFLLNYYFNFNYRGRGFLSQFRTFFVVATVGTILTAVLARAFLLLFHVGGIVAITVFGWPLTAEFLAHLLSVGVVTIYSFLGHKYFSFNVGIRGQLRNTLHHFRDET